MGEVHREYYTVNHGISIFPTDPLINATKSATYYQRTAFIQISKCMRSIIEDIIIVIFFILCKFQLRILSWLP